MYDWVLLSVAFALSLPPFVALGSGILVFILIDTTDMLDSCLPRGR